MSFLRLMSQALIKNDPWCNSKCLCPAYGRTYCVWTVSPLPACSITEPGVSRGKGQVEIPWIYSCPVSLLAPKTYLYPWVIKSGIQYNITNDVSIWTCTHACLYLWACLCMHIPTYPQTHYISPVLQAFPFSWSYWTTCKLGLTRTTQAALHWLRETLLRRTLGILSRVMTDQPCHVDLGGVGWAPFHTALGCRLLTLSGGSGIYFRPLWIIHFAILILQGLLLS